MARKRRRRGNRTAHAPVVPPATGRGHALADLRNGNRAWRFRTYRDRPRSSRERDAVNDQLRES